MDNKEVKTLKDLAEYTGFTIATVSRVLNELGSKYRISEKTQNIIKNAAIEKKFSFNENARGLRLNKTFTIGLLVPDISNAFFSKIASLIDREAKRNKYSVFLCDCDNSTITEKSSVTLLENRKVDGVIAFPVGLEFKHLLDLNKNTPVIFIDRFFENIDIPYVTTDDYEGSCKAVQHLIDLGHKKIACIQGLQGTSQNNNRVNGYINTLLKNNIQINKNLIIGNNFDEISGYKAAKKLIKMKLNEKPTAILSLSNIITLGILKAFSESNIIIPEQISIISFDEESYSALLNPPLTTISQPKEDIGKLAFKMLLKQIKSKNNTKVDSIILPTKLILRNSTKRHINN